MAHERFFALPRPTKEQIAALYTPLDGDPANLGGEGAVLGGLGRELAEDRH